MVLLYACQPAQQSEQIKVGFSQCLSNHDWRLAMNDAMRLQASLKNNIDLEIYEAYGDLNTQIRQIRQMITNGTDIIIVSPLYPDPLIPVITEAESNGIPVILIDRKINSENFTAYVGSDNREVGRIAARYIASSPHRPLHVVELKGGDGSSASTERSEGFNEVAGRLENVIIVGSIMGDREGLDKETFHQLLDSLRGTTIDFVFAFNDQMAIQAWEVARARGVEDQIDFIGVDGLNTEAGGIKRVQNGVLEATILYPTGGVEVIKLAEKIAQGERVPKVNTLETTLIDQFNADIMESQFDKITEHQEQIETQFRAIDELENNYMVQNTLLKITFLLITILLGLAAYTIYSILEIRKKNRQLLLTNKKITNQRNHIEKIAEEIRQSNEARVNFFTGLSHEFKTPLTLIISALETLRDNLRAHGKREVYELQMIENNSNRLLRLINNLLDFRKIENKQFNLRVSKTNIANFSKKIYQDFQREAQKRSIQFNLMCNNEALELYIDRNLMDKVYFNLLSNAFKFTPDHGKIEIRIEDFQDSNQATITFSDNGIGIPIGELKEVFSPFFKGSNNRKNSSGIGLHLSKQFIELHTGEIAVHSKHGTEFVIQLFKGHTHFNEDQIVDEPELEDVNDANGFQHLNFNEEYGLQEYEPNDDRYSILIIEDNIDLKYFLTNKLKTDFDVFLSEGDDAVALAVEHVPDIIICDINLPGHSGFEICATIKEDFRTSHIPTIILTALDDNESYIKGLESKADLYLTKPFSYAVLLQSIKMLLYNREKLRFYFTNSVLSDRSQKVSTDHEQDFIHKMQQIIQDNLDDSQFSVEALAHEMGISRVQLYRKVKAILGYGINDHISNVRLDNAKVLLQESDHSVSEIAYMCGFSSPSYFSTAFKSKFGTSPGTYKKAAVR